MTDLGREDQAAPPGGSGIPAGCAVCWVPCAVCHWPDLVRSGSQPDPMVQ